MTQLDTRPQADVKSSPAQPMWWIALLVAGVAGVVAVVVFIGNITNQPTVFKDAQVPVTVKDYKVVLPSNQMSGGAKTLQITNRGSTAHELLVFKPATSVDPSHLPLDADGNISEDGADVNLISDGDNIDVGNNQTRDLDLSQPGTYVFVCNLPGHYKLGMWSKVTVTG